MKASEFLKELSFKIRIKLEGNPVVVAIWVIGIVAVVAILAYVLLRTPDMDEPDINPSIDGGSQTQRAEGMWPLPIAGRVCGVWGEARGGGSRSHKGLDICAPTGTPIYASFSGRVYRAGQLDSKCGMGVVISRQYNTENYCHMSRVIARVGQQVRAGDLIGYVGNTGNSGTPHLHIGITRNRQWVNPQPLLRRP